MGCFIKICGLARAEDVAALAALRPDAIGLVFWPQSRRAVSAEQAAPWLRDVPPGILKIGVFVGDPPETVARTVERAGLDAAQLHGREIPSDFSGFPHPLWRAIRVGPAQSDDWRAWSVDAYLLDSYSADAPGGTGRVCDWNAAARWVADAPRPVLLAGGLTPDNVRAAVRTVRPWGVDVSTGVERAPGIKDLDKVKAFIERCRAE